MAAAEATQTQRNLLLELEQPRAAQLQQQQQQQQQEPRSIYNLWGSGNEVACAAGPAATALALKQEAAAAAEAANTGLAAGNAFLPQNYAASQNSSNNNHNNNNYVNFSEFISRHNFQATPQSYTAAAAETATGAQNNFENQAYFTAYGRNGYNPFQHSSNNPFLNYNTEADTATDNGAFLPFGNNNERNEYRRADMSYYNNFYSNPFEPTAAATTESTESVNDIVDMLHNSNFYTNAFDTGFDFYAKNSTGAAAAAAAATDMLQQPKPLHSQLQAAAPEFVPRFSQLSLSENGAAKATNGVAVNEPNAAAHALADYGDWSGVLEQAASSTTLAAAGHNSTQTRANNTNNNNKSEPAKSLAKTAHNSHAQTSNGYANTSAADVAQKNYDKQPANRTEQRRYSNGLRRSMDERYSERAEERYERVERNSAAAHAHRNGNQRDRYDNHRSNKRRDDWNRNRDRINGFRLEEKYATDNGKDSPQLSPEKRSPNKNNSFDSNNDKLSQREKLIRDIETRRLECLVCVETIKSHNSVWSCLNCYHIFHLNCIMKWASASKSDDGWRCPACQNVLKEVPRDYYCFCGKVKNPNYTRQDIAHSCGEVCGRIEGCTHSCTLLCHPGPCPPCQANVKRVCGCGKTTRTMQCCVKDSIACEEICGKPLNCDLHMCSSKCHAGKCPPCAEKVEQKCHCHKQERKVACTRESHDKQVYSCGKPCGRQLSCGNHKCKENCHAGDCRVCKLSPEVVTKCPCGKKNIHKDKRKSCLDAIPLCENVCGKTLRCGPPAKPHHCSSKCHHGNCPPCGKQTAVKCRCGHMDQMIKCRQLSTRADDARCKKRCTKKRSCGKHKCNQECCIDIDHICTLPCNYTLSCGKHKCDQPCHRGNCPPCYRSSFEELYCECGAQVIYPPVPCGTKRPACNRPCSREHACEHPPQHTCHSFPTCPPCIVFTTQWCYGQHEQRKTIPCSQKSFSCGLACQKPLPCGRHKCIRSCHEGDCRQTPNEICKQSCTKLRASCGHKCMAPCHEGECPETPCKEMVEVQCECGNRKQMRSCHDLAREYSRITTAQLASSMAEMQRGNYMELSEILNPIKIKNSNKTLDCNEECRTLERNRRLAMGLQIRNPDVSQKLLTKYSDFVRNFAKRDPALVKSVYEALTQLVKLAKESKQKSRSHSFPTMNREKRQLVHELCEMFGVEAVAYDAEPNRNVVATAFKDRSWLPATSIMEVIQRESGQRRVPVPSNNAWGLKR